MSVSFFFTKLATRLPLELSLALLEVTHCCNVIGFAGVSFSMSLEVHNQFKS